MQAGKLLGPYEIIAPLGVGGMGEVYKARDTRLDRVVAIKVLSEHLAQDPQLKQRFEREARAVASLNHPHICVLYDVGRQDIIDYLVMEYLEGDTLANHLLKNGALSLDQILRYAIEIADALDKAHRQGITHRDLKPGNIMLTKSGAKLLDFGLSKATKPVIGSPASVAPTELTSIGSLMGTFQYMAPEQLEGKAADHRSDIFAYGAVLYEMCEGRRVFDATTQARLIAAIMQSDPPPLTKLEHPALDHVVRHCMEKDPADRFQSARDIVVTLQSVSLSTPSRGIRKGKLAASLKRPRMAWALAAISLVAFLATLAVLLTRGALAEEWIGAKLGGPLVALAPRISPDGHTLAFAAMIDGQTQLAVMTPSSGNWTLLTQERTLGEIDHFAWSPDGSKIYFDRSVARAVFSIPALGGESRKVLDDAVFPEALPDGTLLVARNNAHGETQLHHFHPENGQVDALPAAVAPDGGLRVFPDGKEAVLYGSRVRPTLGSTPWR